MAETQEISIVGYACRLPSAPHAAALWTLLSEQRCAIGRIGPDRFEADRFRHSDRAVPGKSYTFAAGVIENVFDFDPGYFGISPREAVQMDPQQRLLLQVTHEALEHAGIPASRLAGEKVGVFVGASSSDYFGRFMFDPAAIDLQMMTGNTLSILSNRISYIFDLRGPSFTIDTACSSSLVALHEACEALRAGRIDTAIVAGVNVLASPIAFIGFARASMLSPTGLCRAFDADGDGYVRAEGAVTLVLRNAGRARAAGDRVRASIVGTGINADGRTIGMSLPSSEMQAALLGEVYERFRLDPADLAFVEAHGTGTKVGDPAEAGALGRMLGARRGEVLPIGSIKSNVGHLEPASGLAGVLKSILALEHGTLPATLHVRRPNPEIPFKALNLAVAAEPVALPRRAAPRLAGINSFGFGGTNAHAVIREAEARPNNAAATASVPLVVTAHAREALRALAARYRDALAGARPTEIAPLLAAAAHGRDRLEHRLATPPLDRNGLVAALEGWLAGEKPAEIVEARVPGGRDGGLVFVFSGNGSQWAGMGRAAHAANADFRAAFAAVDRLFMARAGWSLATALASADLSTEIGRTEVAQPLLFAVQVGIVEALAARGIRPEAVVGHSVGEVAAAWASGALDLADAVRAIHARSTNQEMTRHLGGMAALLMPPAEAEAAIAAAGLSGLEIAAVNSPRGVTVSGSAEALDRFLAHARAERWAFKRLDLDYPFHCAMVDPIRAPLLAALAGLRPRPSRIPFVSTVTGDVRPGETLDAAYWWDNVRRPVAFDPAIRTAAGLGGRVMLEIGPRPVLGTYVKDILADLGHAGAVLGSLDRADGEGSDPIARITAAVLANGGAVDTAAVFGPRAHSDRLPGIAWQNQTFRIEPTDEALPIFRPSGHPLIGVDDRAGAPSFTGHLDRDRLPWLGQHVVDGTVVMPAAGLAEMALAAAHAHLGVAAIELSDFDILRALVLDGEPRETNVRLTEAGTVVEIASRRRLSGDDWTLHARGRLAAVPNGPAPAPASGPAARTVDADALYRLTAAAGLDYGPAFRRAASVELGSDGEAVLRYTPDPCADDADHLLHATRLDAAFHGLFALIADRLDADWTRTFLPTRFGALRLHRPGAAAASALIRITKASARSIEAAFTLVDGAGDVVAELTGARFSAVSFARNADPDDLVYRTVAVRLPQPGLGSAVEAAWPKGPAAATERLGLSGRTDPNEARFLVEAAAIGIAAEAVARIAGDDAAGFTLDALVAEGRLHPAMRPLAARLLAILAEDGAAEPGGRGWRLFDRAGLPPVEVLIRTIVADHPAWIAEAIALAHLAEELAPRLAEGSTAPFGSLALRDHLFEAAPSFAFFAVAPTRIVADLVQRARKDRPLDILLLGAENHGLVRRLLTELDPETGRLAVTDPDPVALDRLAAMIGANPSLVRVPWAEFDGGDGRRFDLAISADGAHRWPDIGATLTFLARGLAPGGALVLAEPAPGPFLEMVRGLDPDWWRTDGNADRAVGRLPGMAVAWTRLLADAGFAMPQAAPLADGSAAGFLVTAVSKAAVEPAADRPPNRVPAVLVTNGEGRGRALTDALVAQLNGGRRPVHILIDRRPADGVPTASYPTTVVPLDGDPASDAALAAALPSGEIEIVFAFGASAEEESPEIALTARTGAFAALARALRDRAVRIWAVVPGAVQAIAGVDVHRPVQAGFWAFLRVVANEHPNLDIRALDVSPTLAPSEAAIRIAREIAIPGEDREIVIDTDRRSALRVVRGGPLAAARPTATDGPTTRRLDIAAQGSLDRLAWTSVPRCVPGPGEVEIEVRATGLNFRDVMWAMGLLPPEALEDGFAGPTLGMECAGRVVAVGAGVEHLRVGDDCVAFAAAAFAGHVTVPAHAVARLPAGFSPEAAATIPVAFLTAWYALVQLAAIEPGETVLIHGGAGGLGLAALQIARSRGARVIATAGNREKRTLLSTLGAEHVLDSRSLAFGDEVLRITGGAGVDVVLNSLAGEAMERSVGCLKPFGRFLELGKRDFYANTRLGLRPFRQNLSYHGIDADQLLTGRPALAGRLFGEVMAEFEAGRLTALPHRSFEAEEATAAFRLMQQAGHTGKIVLRMPSPASAETPAGRGFRVDPEARYLIVGGLGGFGLALARRLARRGARDLVLVGRRGRTDAGGEGVLAEIEALGARVRSAAVDAADRESFERFFRSLSADGVRLAGVFHAAMVLDDALIRNLSPDRIAAVLRPKVTAAAMLDRLTRGLDLDAFVLFSSATTLVGNPGQANYVAANAYLEALARKRRAKGLPGLAVGWGAIADAGFLARNAEVGAVLSRRLGRAALKVEEALDGLEALLAADPSDAALGFARIDWSAAAKELPLAATPLLSGLAGAAGDAPAAVGDSDLLTEIAGLTPAAALDRIARVLAVEIGRILRMPAEEIDRKKPLAEIGMDSLMALELRMAAESRLGVDVPLMSLANGASLADIAGRIAARIQGGAPPAPEAAPSVAITESHALGEGLSAEDLAAVTDAIERRGQGVRRVFR